MYIRVAIRHKRSGQWSYGQKEKRSPTVFAVISAKVVLQPRGLVHHNGH